MARWASLKRLRKNQNGATAIEYGLICGIMMLAVLAIAATGGALDSIYDLVGGISDELNENPGGPGDPR